jgi:hypothetical protein
MTFIPIDHADDDDKEFLSLVSSAIRGMLQISAPEHYAIFKTDNWFDDNWITRRDEDIRFPSKRVVQVIRDGEVDVSGDRIPAYGSRFYVSGHTTRFYISGHSSINRRGSLMGRFEAEESVWLWYVGFKDDLSWQAVRHKNISRTAFSEYIKAGT